jgi:hypothetical protein
VPFDRNELVALIVAVCFAAGLNVYATVATLGLLARAGVLTLPGSLELVSNWWVIGISGAMFVLEFFADKIPVFDLVWNVLQTAVRIPAGAVLAYAAAQPLGLGGQLVAAVAGGTISFAAHSGKLAARTAATTSPEPASNFFLSLAEDAFAIGITWFATQHPFLAAGIVLTLLAVIVLSIRWVIRAFRRRRALRQKLHHEAMER